MIGWLQRTLAGLAAIGAALAWAFMRGKRAARQETALEAAERIAAAERKRRDIEDAIQADTDLAARARRIGLQRGPGE